VRLVRLAGEAALDQRLVEVLQGRIVDRLGVDSLHGAEAHQPAQRDPGRLGLEPAGELAPRRQERIDSTAGQEVSPCEVEGLAEQGADVAPAGRAQAVRGRRDAGQEAAEGAGVGGDGFERQAEGAVRTAERRSARSRRPACSGWARAASTPANVNAGAAGAGSRARVRDAKIVAMYGLVMT
jgi:hypothetical protein